MVRMLRLAKKMWLGNYVEDIDAKNRSDQLSMKIVLEYEREHIRSMFLLRRLGLTFDLQAHLTQRLVVVAFTG